MSERVSKGPKVLLLDIETTPMVIFAWALGEQHVGVEQIIEDWSILCWSAKWLGDEKIFFESTKRQKDKRDDSKILKGIWKLLDEADIIITQNGKHFDVKKLNARFILNQIKPPSGYKHIDIFQTNRSKFGFTSNKLVYITEKLNNKYKKLDHKKFPGLDLWKECLKGNSEAWKEMEVYNKHDVLSLEEAYNLISPWDDSVDFNLYHESTNVTCKCGSTEFESKGYRYTTSGKFRRFVCKKCGHHTRSKVNLFSKEKKQSLRPSGNN